MKTRFSFFKRAQRGQTIVILALAFIVLLGFVGLVTDISLMFVRYNTLRRAVDSAAVAAAGQVRRTLPTTAEINKAKTVDIVNWQKVADGYAFARNIATVNLAARQFIEFYGLSPSTVLVDTCATTPDDVELQCKPNPATPTKVPPPRKLVRVTAQLLSPTVFLHLLGWNNVLLEATSISETAVLDVVLIFDTSESMLNQTSYDDWANTPYPMRYMPPRMVYPPATLGNTPKSLQTVLANSNPPLPAAQPYDGYNIWTKVLSSVTQAQINNDNTIYPVIPYLSTPGDASNAVTVKSLSDAGQALPQCRVRFYPASGGNTIPDGKTGFWPADDIRVEYTNVLKAMGANPSGSYSSIYDGFVPMYNFYGCCNDPNQDGKFDDLVCQPFKKMRDATGSFLQHIDFLRGDRVAYVTFDRSAFLIDPDGSGKQETMITSEDAARTALVNIVGVRAEPSAYADTNLDGLWDSYVVRGTYDKTDPAKSGIPFRYDAYMPDVASGVWVPGGFDNTALGVLNNYPVYNDCYFQNAAAKWPRSLYSSPSPGDNGIAGHPYVASRYPTPMAAFGKSDTTFIGIWPDPTNFAMPPTLMLPNLNDPAWHRQNPAFLPQQRTASEESYDWQGGKPVYSYESAAGCGSSNVGAALRVGNNALLNKTTVRTNGAVWVMVMLGDGAAASSDPVQRNKQEPKTSSPYTDPTKPVGPPGEYGAYGVCPYGTPDEPGGLVDENWSNAQPRCSDTRPETRHPFCFKNDSSHTDTKKNSLFIELTDDPRCETVYDVDDFARDWADYVALSNPFPEQATQDANRDALQLPTIFTIGFGLDFLQPPQLTCSGLNTSDCLGEELLRYIADAGDNQRIDTDYQQDLKRDGYLDGLLTNNELTYGDRGPCEGPVLNGYPNADAARAAGPAALISIVNPLPPTVSCGNYYNAPDATRLQFVFDDIASRMFTRLTH